MIRTVEITFTENTNADQYASVDIPANAVLFEIRTLQGALWQANGASGPQIVADFSASPTAFFTSGSDFSPETDNPGDVRFHLVDRNLVQPVFDPSPRTLYVGVIGAVGGGTPSGQSKILVTYWESDFIQ